jgi:transcription-repair coupling factor (superfamily II helicase)
MDLSRLLTRATPADLPGLPAAAKALTLLRLGGPFVAVAPTEEEARVLHADACFLAAALGVPAPVLLPPPEARLTGGRLEAVERITSGAGPSVVTDRAAAASPIWRGAELRRAALPVRRADELDRDFLVELLVEMGYRRVALVAGVGELAVRAGQADVFPAAAGLPVRLTFEQGRVASVREFDTDSQRSTRELPAVTLFPAREPEGAATVLSFLDGHTVVGEAAFAEAGAGWRGAPDADGAPRGRGPRPVAGLGLTARERKRAGEGLPTIGPRLAALAGAGRVVVAAGTLGEAERLCDLLAAAGVRVPISSPTELRAAAGPIAVVRGRLSGGFSEPEAGVLFVTAAEIFGSRPPARAVARSHIAELLSSLDDLQPGDCVVHVDHGIGRYLGIEQRAGGDCDADFMRLEYAGGATVLLPVERIDLIRRYHAAGAGAPRLDTVGGSAWRKAKSRARENVRAMAETLLRLQAARLAAPGHAFPPDGEAHREFADAFPYEETPDQRQSIEEIRGDMEAPRPMDRLLCGDVGYGKTEVALRAVFKAVADRRQVAVLAPTTLLAEQHAATFAGRCAAFPVRVGALTRFTGAAEEAETLRGLAAHELDVVVGTHRLLGRDVVFADLGLIVVDEEQRFGVVHKERIRALRAGVDVLTLSATPIPRTLHLALSGLRPVSTLATPPEERLAVQTVVARFDAEVIRAALEREFARGGQAYFVHNRIESIAKVGVFLQRLLPGRRIGIAHARLPEKALEEVMHRFHAGETDLLLATAIVGAGLDIPRANTLLVDRADRFGLADLYQLKGRVGRSDVRAAAYFLVPHEDRITEEAKRRLEALQDLSFLGAGFRLALKDLEIRGAGDLLGAEQSGNIEAVGYDLYLEMLREAVAELSGQAVAPQPEPVLELRGAAHLPAGWIEDPAVRFALLRRFAAAREESAVAELRRELLDRFGPPPPEAARLLDLAELKAACRRAAVGRIEEPSDRRYRVLWADPAAVPVSRLLALPEKSGERIVFLAEGGFEIDFGKRSREEIFRRLKKVLALVPQPAGPAPPPAGGRG